MINRLVVRSYNQAVMRIIKNFSTGKVPVLNTYEINIDSVEYIIDNLFKHKLDLKDLENYYNDLIYPYLFKSLALNIPTFWPVSKEQLHRVLEGTELIFTGRGVENLIEERFSPESVSKITRDLTFLISQEEPTQLKKKGAEIGMNRAMGESHNNTWVAILLFFIFIIFCYVAFIGEPIF